VPVDPLGFTATAGRDSSQPTIDHVSDSDTTDLRDSRADIELIPEVSILIVHYGPLAPLRRALESIRRQSGVRLETIVVDNSEDGAAEAIPH
jgi:hypothetical protein